jgi:class 3 adenylate cyclase
VPVAVVVAVVIEFGSFFASQGQTGRRPFDVGAALLLVAGGLVARSADPGDVVASSTVKDLVAGSGIAFADRGEHALRGLPDRWRLYAVADAASA